MIQDVTPCFRSCFRSTMRLACLRGNGRRAGRRELTFTVPSQCHLKIGCEGEMDARKEERFYLKA